jgi:hypothetical protein
MTREEILSNFPDAGRIRFGTFFDLPTCLFDSNYFAIEIRMIDEGFLVKLNIPEYPTSCYTNTRTIQ